MKILMVNHYAQVPDQPGGTRHYSLAKGLIARGHEVVVVASGFDHDRREDRLLPGEEHRLEEIAGVPFLWLRTPGYQGNGASRLWNMLVFQRAVKRRLLDQTWRRPDLVIGSTPHPFGALASLRLAQRLGVPFVLEIRDVWPESLVEVMGVPRHHPIIWVLGRIERELYRGAAHIVTLLPTVARRVAERGGDPAAITWVPNGIDLDLVPAPSRPQHRDTFTVIYPGSLGVSNALDVMVDAGVLLQARAERLPRRMDLVLMGTGPERDRIQARIAAAGLRNFRVLPPVPKRDVYEVLRTADAFWSSSRATALWQHGISFNKLYDFLAMARPTVIGLDAPNNPIAEAGAGITVKPGDPEALADGLEQMVNLSEDARWEMGLRGNAYVRAHFDLRALAARLESALLDACDAHYRRAHAS